MTEHSAGGFFGTIRAALGPEAAQNHWNRAVAEIDAAEPDATEEEKRRLLDSPIGRHMADDVLNGLSVARQIADRPGRFRRHLKSVQEQIIQERREAAEA